MQISELTVGIVQTCCYVLGKEDGQECIVIDPGAEAERIRKAAGDRRIAAILLTHGHFDHIGATQALLNSQLRDRENDERRPLDFARDDKESIRIFIHALDAPMLTDPVLNAGKGLLGREITAPIWSKCPWVSRIAAIFFPPAAFRIRAASSPGSITIHSSLSSSLLMI